MDTELPLPSAQAWEASGLRVLDEIVGGHQSRVVLAEADGERVVVKLRDSRAVVMTAPAPNATIVLGSVTVIVPKPARIVVVVLARGT